MLDFFVYISFQKFCIFYFVGAFFTLAFFCLRTEFVVVVFVGPVCHNFHRGYLAVILINHSDI
jgi:hypothetical protein